MLAFAHDLQFGIRTLFKNPGFTFVAILSLGLGIGAVTSVYSMVSSVLLTPLPFEEANRLFTIASESRQTHENNDSVSYPAFSEWRRQSTSFEYMAAYSGAAFNMTGGDAPARIGAARVSSAFFPLFRIPMALGRNFSAGEDIPGAVKTAILTHKAWKNRFDGMPDVVGSTVTFDGEPYQVIGVLPEDFLFLPTMDAEAYVAIGANTTFADNWGASWLDVIARLKNGVTPEQAQAEMATIADRLSQQYPNYMGDRTAVLISGNEDVEDDVAQPFAILSGVVVFVLLIACANVANLLLSKAASRQKEIAIRAALGASRTRIVRQLLTEALLLSVLGGGLGVLIAMWGIDIIISLLPAENAQAYVKFFRFGMNADVLAFSAAASIVTGFIFGLAPALQASKPDLNETLKEGGAGTGLSRRRHRVLNTLVVVEVALALVLLIGATLMVQSYTRLKSADPGFDTNNILTLSLELTEKTYPNPESILAFQRSLIQRLAQLPGVKGVGTTNSVPFAGSESINSLGFEDLPELPAGQYRAGGYRIVSPGYLDALGVSLKAGRMLTDQDNNPQTPVAVVNQVFVDTYWNGQDAINKRFCLGSKWGRPDALPITVVGIVSNVRHREMKQPPHPEFYLPFAQRANTREFELCVRSETDPGGLATAIREIVRDLDPNQPLSHIATMHELIQKVIWMDRFTTLLFAMFSSVALVLAIMGVYGVINYSVIQQTREIGVRMALGAQPAQVLRWIVTRGLRLAGYGLALGLPLTLALGQKLRQLLYGISPYDPATIVAVSIMLAAVAAAASYIPARRAVAVDPNVALRYE